MGKSVGDLFKDLGFILKFVAAICCVVSCGLFGEMTRAAYFDPRTRDLLVISSGGFTIILVAFLIVYGVDETHHVFELIFTIVGGVMNCTSGIFCIIKFIDDTHLSFTLMLGIFGIAAGVLMLVDFVREVKK